jgi:hypothetical protein
LLVARTRWLYRPRRRFRGPVFDTTSIFFVFVLFVIFSILSIAFSFACLRIDVV